MKNHFKDRITAIKRELFIGRSGRIWPHPVPLEPPYTLFDPLEHSNSGQPPVRGSVTTEPEEFQILRIRPSEDDKYPSDLAEQFITSLSSYSPVSYEVLGVEGEVTIQMVASPQDAGIIIGQIEAHYPICEVFEAKDILHDVSERLRFVRSYRLRRSHLFSLRDSHRTEPYTALVGLLSTLGSQDVALFQVLFMKARHNWKRNILRVARDSFDPTESAFPDNPHLPKRAEAKVSKPLYAVAIRTAASSKELLDILEDSFLVQFESEENGIEAI